MADAERVKTEATDLVDFIRQMPFLLETERYIFVHAGLDLELKDWRETSDYQKVWIRAPFHEGSNQTGKKLSLAIHRHFISCMKRRELTSSG